MRNRLPCLIAPSASFLLILVFIRILARALTSTLALALTSALALTLPLTLTLILLQPDSAAAAEAVNCATRTCRYVRAGATGSNSGMDWTNAYTSLPTTLIRGATYFVADGTYPGYDFKQAADQSKVITILKAIESNHGTGTGWNSTYGDGQAVWSSLDFTTSDFAFDGQTGGGPGQWTSGFGFRINQGSSTGVAISSSNITMRHFEIQGQLTDGAIGVRTREGASNIMLSYYYMNNIGNCPFALIPVADFVAEYGYVGRFYGSEASHSEIASIWGGVKGTTTFRYNVFAHVESTGGIMWDNNNDHAARLYIYGNVFYRPSTNSAWSNNANGLIGGWTDGGSDLYNMRIYNNSFVNITGRIFTDFVVRSGDNEVYNNLFYNSTAPSYADIQRHNYNHYINSGGIQGEANGTTGSGDPFMDHANLDFRLKAATPAGVTVGAPMTTDMLNAIRGGDGTTDRGAMEFGSGGSVPPTPTPAPAPSLRPPERFRWLSVKSM